MAELQAQEYRRLEHWEHSSGLCWWSAEHCANVHDCLQLWYVASGGDVSTVTVTVMG